MKLMSAYLQKLRKIRSQRGFTMIELLIVISILGILAVAVLSAINPVEQINRGRDTGTRSDAEQLLSAIDRFNAFQGFFPWQEDANDTDLAVDPIEIVDDTTPTVTLTSDGTVCPTLFRLSIGVENAGTPTDCIGSQELKESFIDRIVNSAGARDLFIYNRGDQGDSTYVCFVPQSGAFITEAEQRCTNGLPTDLADMEAIICDTGGARGGTAMAAFDGDGAAICLP